MPINIRRTWLDELAEELCSGRDRPVEGECQERYPKKLLGESTRAVVRVAQRRPLPFEFRGADWRLRPLAARPARGESWLLSGPISRCQGIEPKAIEIRSLRERCHASRIRILRFHGRPNRASLPCANAVVSRTGESELDFSSSCGEVIARQRLTSGSTRSPVFDQLSLGSDRAGRTDLRRWR